MRTMRMRMRPIPGHLSLVVWNECPVSKSTSSLHLDNPADRPVPANPLAERLMAKPIANLARSIHALAPVQICDYNERLAYAWCAEERRRTEQLEDLREHWSVAVMWDDYAYYESHATADEVYANNLRHGKPCHMLFYHATHNSQGTIANSRATRLANCASRASSTLYNIANSSRRLSGLVVSDNKSYAYSGSWRSSEPTLGGHSPCLPVRPVVCSPERHRVPPGLRLRTVMGFSTFVVNFVQASSTQVPLHLTPRL